MYILSSIAPLKNKLGSKVKKKGQQAVFTLRCVSLKCIFDATRVECN